MFIIYLSFCDVSLSFTNPNFIRFDIANELHSLGMFNYINNNSKEKQI